MPLASSTGSLKVFTEETKTVDLEGAGLSLDGTATLVSVGQPTCGQLTSHTDGTYTYVPSEGFVGNDPFEVTYRSSAGNEQSFTIDVLVERPGPIASWNFDEGAGTIAADGTGGGNTGQVLGASWTEGYAGNALEFDGIDDRVLLGTGPSLEGLTDFTVMAMVRTTATSGGIVIQQRNGGFNGEYILKTKANGGVNFWMYGDFRYQFNITSPGAIHDGQWHHVAAGRDADDGFFYIGGQLAVTGSGSVVNLRSHIAMGIGADIRDNGQYFLGAIDEFCALCGRERRTGSVGQALPALNDLNDVVIVEKSPAATGNSHWHRWQRQCSRSLSAATTSNTSLLKIEGNEMSFHARKSELYFARTTGMHALQVVQQNQRL